MTHSPRALREHSIALVAYAREVRAIAAAARLWAVKARTMAQAARASSEKRHATIGRLNSPLTKSMEAPFEQQNNPTGRRCDSFVRREAQARFDVASRGATGILSTGC
jgi:hypothetical protein